MIGGEWGRRKEMSRVERERGGDGEMREKARIRNGMIILHTIG